MFRFFAILIFLNLMLLLGCEFNEQPFGLIHVRSLNSGQFEIYRLKPGDNLQFFAELKGEFNKDIRLAPGDYLLIADCSSYPVVVRPSGTKTINVHRIEFKPEGTPSKDNKFIMECRRTRDLRFRQKIENRFYLDVFEGEVEILAGMKSMAFNFSREHYKEPSLTELHLSSVLLRSVHQNTNSNEFFVSNAQEKIALTQSQKFEEHIFLLPGEYVVELNGTRHIIELAERQNLVLDAGYFRVETSKEVNIETSLEVSGTPLQVTVNDHHTVHLNETYPVLPGTLRLKLSGNELMQEIVVEPNETSALSVKSIIIDSGCSVWYWECRGRRKIYLYEGEKTYSFAEGVTDVPLLFFNENVWVGIEGAYDIRYRILDKRRDTVMSLGLAHVVPEPELSKTLLTDLGRIETIQESHSGQTLDIDFLTPSTYPLIPGQYQIASYATVQGAGGRRVQYKRHFTVHKGETTQVKLPVHLPPTRYQNFMNQRKRVEQQRLQSIERKWRSSYRPGKRLNYR